MIVFLAGEKRTASPGANFLLHDTVFNPMVGASLRFDDLIGQAEAITHNDDWSHELFAQILERPTDEVAEWFRGQTTRDTQFALDNGLIENVQPLMIPRAAEFVQVAYKF